MTWIHAAARDTVAHRPLGSVLTLRGSILTVISDS